MIYCIWYPSGGFGHFINTVISIYGMGFYRPSRGLELSENGNSHAVPLVLPKYKSNQPYFMPKLDISFRYSVLVDNGIDDESTDFLQTFPGAQVIKVCYDDRSWPVVAYTHIVKAMTSSLDDQLPVAQDLWPDHSDWSRREKFFLYLRDHFLRQAWRPDTFSRALPLSSLYEYERMKHQLESVGIEISAFSEDWQTWRAANARYLQPVLTAQHILDTLQVDQDLSHITDLWTQAVIYYYLWLEFGREVPHNDYADFFASTGEIRRWLDL